MPVIIPQDLPAAQVLKKENIFIIHNKKQISKNNKIYKIVILNLMPTKVETERQILRLLANAPLYLDIKFLKIETHKSKNTSQSHLKQFYSSFEDIKEEKFHGMIITGAPVEQLDFEDVDYFEELKKIFKYTKTNVKSTIHICWGAQAALYYHFGISKYKVLKKIFGVFKHKKLNNKCELLKEFNDEFYVPHSRNSEILEKDIKAHKNLEILAESEEVGPSIVQTKDKKHIFITGHLEYEPDTLKYEYERDIDKGIDIDIPDNYFLKNNKENEVMTKWISYGKLLFLNWINYYLK